MAWNCNGCGARFSAERPLCEGCRPDRNEGVLRGLEDALEAVMDEGLQASYTVIRDLIAKHKGEL